MRGVVCPEAVSAFLPAPESPAGTPLPPTEHIEIGYRLLRRHWGQGYATEMAIEVLGHRFDRLSLSRIIAACKPANAASSRVLLKAGISYEGRGHYDSALVDVYAASKGGWSRPLGGSARK
jgi:RimJ/RimL family protein N-acetyltransferase